MARSDLVSVGIPIGPLPHHVKHLYYCLDSIAAQTLQPYTVQIIDDMQGCALHKIIDEWKRTSIYPVEFDVKVWQAPWHIGIPIAVNFYIALSPTECIVMHSGDDLLHPRCVELCEKAYIENDKRDAYYWLGVRFIDEHGQANGKDNMHLPSGPAMVTKGLWKATGGHMPESSVGKSDSILVGIMQEHGFEFIEVEPTRVEPLVVFRCYDYQDQENRRTTGWFGAADVVKNLAITQWKRPEWGRFE